MVGWGFEFFSPFGDTISVTFQTPTNGFAI
jgi:hypothetical protein